jgi:hypothetical protein
VAFFASALFGIIFETPLTAAAVAGGAVSIPIIIHLLNRKRFRVVTWAAMRFLLAAQKKNSRRMRIEQLLLLLVRCAIVLLLVIAMASISPWAEAVWHWVDPAGGLAPVSTGQRTHKTLVLDASMSMGLKVENQTCFERARAMAMQLVRESAGGDGFSVVLMASPARRIVSEASEDAKKVLSEIEALHLTHGNADLASTLSAVEGIVGASPGKYPQREVYFFTDLQQSTWIARNPGTLSGTVQKIKARASTIFVDVGKEGAANVAVTSLMLGESVAMAGRETPILAVLHNFGPTKQDVSVRLSVGRARENGAEKAEEPHEVAEVVVHKLEHRQPTPVAFKYAFPRQGDYVLQVRVQHDDLDVDDTRSAVVTVKNTIPVLLVNGKPAPQLYDRATEWLRTALKPFEDNDVSVVSPKVISAAQFSDEGLGDLGPYDCVYLCDVARFSPAEVRRLDAHVRRGGSVVFTMGDRVDVASYNESLYKGGKGLLPAKLVGTQKAPEGWQYKFRDDREVTRTDPLRAFRDEAAWERLLLCRFWQFMQVEPAPRGGPRQVIRFIPVALPGTEKKGDTAAPPDGPAILEWNPPVEKEVPGRPASRLRGRVVLITTTVNSDWNNWPASPTFPPLMHEVLYFAAAPRLREQTVDVGEPIELPLPQTGGGVAAAVKTPDGRTENAASEPQADGSVIRWIDTDLTGLYTITVGNDPHEHFYAVNVPAVEESQQATESDLTRTTRDELLNKYKEWEEIQVVADLREVKHTSASAGTQEVAVRPLGPIVARWLLLVVLALVLAEVVLAWQFGHYSASAMEEQRAVGRSRWAWVLTAATALLFVFALGFGFILAHDAWTGDFLAFLPDGLRHGVEGTLGIPPPAPGEGSHWRLEYSSYLWDAHADVWLAGFIAIAAAVGVYLVYRREGSRTTAASDGFGRLLRLGLRVGLLLLLLAVLLPQLKLWFERQGWPDVVVLIDDSQSMSTVDRYRDPEIQKVADKLATNEGLTKGERLQLAQALVMRSQPDWLTALLTQRKVRVHVYRCSARAHRIGDATEPEDIAGALDAVKALRADEANDSSQLGTAVRQVLNDFRGASLAAVIMLTDGVTTEGEDLPRVAKYARQVGVPLFFVGIGDSREVRDLYLHDVHAPDSMLLGDTLVVEVGVTAQGYTGGLRVPATLTEKGSDKVLETVEAKVEPGQKSVKIQFKKYKPTEAGEKVYVVKVPVQPDEVDKDNNQIERAVWVHEARPLKVLYIEGYRRYEYHYIKTLFERENTKIKGNKSIDLKVFLVEADRDFATQDRSAVSEFPSRAELNAYDVVLLGDVDPRTTRDEKMTQHLKDLADFVRERGGGLLVIAGERFMPHAYKDTPLKDILPIDLAGEAGGDRGIDPIPDGYQLELTPFGRLHPIFRFVPDEQENDRIWAGLRKMYWYAENYTPKRAAEVLAVHPTLKAVARGEGGAGREAGVDRHPLVVHHFVGAGRVLFLGFDETWRWGFRDNQVYFNRFWIQSMHYLARGRTGRIELRLDRQAPYRRGEPIKIMVRFPEESPPPDPKGEVKVVVERRNSAAAGDTEVRTVQLLKVLNSQPREGEPNRDEERASRYYETLLTQTPEGEYRFWLSEPSVPNPKPHAEARVLASPGEMQRLRMNQQDMERAADESGGKFYSIVDAGKVVEEIPVGTRLTVNAHGPPLQMWNHFVLFLMALGLLTVEWVMRKQKNLL